MHAFWLNPNFGSFALFPSWLWHVGIALCWAMRCRRNFLSRCFPHTARVQNSRDLPRWCGHVDHVLDLMQKPGRRPRKRQGTSVVGNNHGYDPLRRLTTMAFVGYNNRCCDPLTKFMGFYTTPPNTPPPTGTRKLHMPSVEIAHE